MGARAATFEQAIDPPKVNSERGHRVIAVLIALQDNPSLRRDQMMDTFAWDEKTMNQVLADVEVVRSLTADA